MKHFHGAYGSLFCVSDVFNPLITECLITFVSFGILEIDECVKAILPHPVYLDVMRKYEAKIIIDLDFGLDRLGIEFFSGFTFYASQ